MREIGRERKRECERVRERARERVRERERERDISLQGRGRRQESFSFKDEVGFKRELLALKNQLGYWSKQAFTSKLGLSSNPGLRNEGYRPQ